MSTKEIEQFNPNINHAQLAMDGEAFGIIATLAEAGAITPVSLDMTDPEMPFEQYEMLGAYLGRMNRSCSWWVGDWLVFGEGAYGERFAQAVSATGLAEQTLLNRAYVSRNVAKSMRRPSLPFSVHREVAAMPPRQQKRWLDKAEKQNWTAAELKAQMRAKRTETPPVQLDGNGSQPVDASGLEEVGRAILRDARESDDPGFYLVPTEGIVRLRAALGEET